VRSLVVPVPVTVIEPAARELGGMSSIASVLDAFVVVRALPRKPQELVSAEIARSDLA
jgi:hypothetical protein